MRKVSVDTFFPAALLNPHDNHFTQEGFNILI